MSADIGAAVVRGIWMMIVIAFIAGVAVVIAGWALWHFVLSHLHWSWG